MRINEEQKIVLVENPLTGNESLGKTLELKPELTVDRWAKPDECRSLLGDKWKDYKKIILVRSVEARFESGATLAFTKPEEFAGPLLDLVLETPEDATPAQRGAAILKHASDGGDLPDFLKPQSEWLKAHFNLVLATYSIAEWSNHHGLYSARSNRNVRVVGSKDAFIPNDGGSSILRDIYADDYKLFETLLVWTPIEDAVRLVNGYCASCAANREDGWVATDLTIDPKSKKATRPRKRKLDKSSDAE